MTKFILPRIYNLHSVDCLGIDRICKLGSYLLYSDRDFVDCLIHEANQKGVFKMLGRYPSHTVYIKSLKTNCYSHVFSYDRVSTKAYRKNNAQPF